MASGPKIGRAFYIKPALFVFVLFFFLMTCLSITCISCHYSFWSAFISSLVTHLITSPLRYLHFRKSPLIYLPLYKSRPPVDTSSVVSRLALFSFLDFEFESLNKIAVTLNLSMACWGWTEDLLLEWSCHTLAIVSLKIHYSISKYHSATPSIPNIVVVRISLLWATINNYFVE